MLVGVGQAILREGSSEGLNGRRVMIRRTWSTAQLTPPRRRRCFSAPTRCTSVASCGMRSHMQSCAVLASVDTAVRACWST